MKLFLRLAAAAVALPMMFASCGGGDDPDLGDLLGNIPGLGNAGGEPTGTPFKLPEGVTLVEGIEGAGENIPDYWGSGNNDYSAAAKPDGSAPVQRPHRNLQTRADDVWLWRGSGEGYVDLLVRLKNDTSSAQTITFPAALIVKSVSGASQHGVLIKKATVSVPAGGEANVVLSLYCGNLFKSSAHSGDEYEWGVVSDSPALLELCELVKNKKINIEEFDPTDSNHYLTYVSQVSELQSIVWDVTDWGGLTDDDRTYIAELPNS